MLSLLLAAALIAALGQFTLSVRSNRALVGEMYDTVEVYANVVNRSGSVGTRVPYEAITMLKDAEFASEYYAEANGPCEWLEPSSNGEQFRLYNFTDPNEFGRAKGIEYGEGYDESVFLTGDERICFVNVRALERFGIKVGDEIRVSGASLTTRMKPPATNMDGVTFRIVGTYSGGLPTGDIIVPFNTMAKARFEMYLGDYADGGVAKKVWFRVENSLLPEGNYADAPNELLASSESSIVRALGLRVMDDEVRNVIEPLSRNTSLLEMLLPVVCAIVLIIGAAIPGLIIVQTSKEAAIMRVIGTTKARVRVILAGEQGVLCLIGLALGLVGLGAAHGFDVSFVRILGETAMYGGAYLALCVAACVLCGIAVSAKKPLELLQARE